MHLGFVRVADEKDLKRLKAKPDPVPEAPAKAWALFRCKCGGEFAAMPEEYTMQARVPCPDCGEPARPVRQAKPEEIGAAGGE